MKKLYNIAMKKLSLSFLMASYLPFALIKGIFFVLLLFFVCFFFTHFTKLALLGWKNNRPVEAPPPKEKEKAPPPQPEPVYYIVERKKSRAKAQYSTPKEIRFK
ncbi:MAG: hypothetical protein IJX30_07175 [Clostridia bacterium]|nr:hypothetical protein [Clostridia bacterium]